MQGATILITSILRPSLIRWRTAEDRQIFNIDYLSADVSLSAAGSEAEVDDSDELTE